MSGPRRRSWNRRRRLVQIAVALFYLALPLAHLAGFRAVAGNLAALRIGPVDLVEPAAGISGALAAGTITLGLALGLLPVVLLAFVLGPVFCSWLCPWGLLSELVDKLPWRARRRPWGRLAWKRSRWPRGVALACLVLAGMVLASPLAATLSAPRLVTNLPLELIYLRILSPVTGGLLLALLALELFGPRRAWCRTLCPAGSTANYLRTPLTLAPHFDSTSCHCPGTPPCQTVCPWGIDPRAMSTYDGCTNCFACIDTCPSGSLEPAFGVPPTNRQQPDNPDGLPSAEAA